MFEHLKKREYLMMKYEIQQSETKNKEELYRIGFLFRFNFFFLNSSTE